MGKNGTALSLAAAAAEPAPNCRFEIDCPRYLARCVDASDVELGDDLNYRD